MKTFAPADIRNFAVVGHASCGKTTLCEAILACSKAIDRMGTIQAGTTVSDQDPEEQERKISIHTTPLHTEWLDRKLNFMDTPGYTDFVGEGLGALHVADFALLVIDAREGVGIGTRRFWNHATRAGIPKILVLNGCDKEGVNFEARLAQIREQLSPTVFPMQLPIDPGPGFHRILDGLRSEVIRYERDGSGRFTEEPAAGPDLARAQALHKELIEHVAESDDTLLEKYLNEGNLSEEIMRSGIHPALQRQAFVPLFCTAAIADVGTARLLDFIAKFGSSPIDHPKAPGTTLDGQTVELNLTGSETVLQVFKTHSEAHAGALSYFRVYSGTVQAGMDLHNPGRNSNERLGPIYLVNGRQRTIAGPLGPGEIGATSRLRDTHTGNTLCNSKTPIQLPWVAYPTPCAHAALVVKESADEDRVAKALAELHEEDPAFQVRHDTELRQTILSAQGDMHLEVLLGQLRRRCKGPIELAEPKIPFRETIRASSESTYRHKKQTGGAGQFAEVWLRIEPLPRGSGVVFEETLTGQNVDRGFVPAVEKGVRLACSEGILAGYQVTDVRINFYDGKMHPVDSKEIAFQTAGYFAFKEAFNKARASLLEPIHKLAIQIPADYAGKIMGDLASRRGRILGMDSDQDLDVIQAEVPASEATRYATVLRALTSGRGEFSEAFSHYEFMPAEIELRFLETQRKNGHTTA